jgi:hypothetical protein
MADRRETIDDIIAEMRGARTEFPFVYLMGEPDTPEVIDFRTKEIIEPRKINIRRVTVKELADRFEAAHKRERGDAAKLREALNLCVDEMCARCRDLAKARGNPAPCLNGCEPVRKAKAALAAPARNCDVGTAEEQTVRYRKFCSSHKYLGSDFSHICKGFGKGRCPFFNSRTKSQCELAWAQMPYEEGGAK